MKLTKYDQPEMLGKMDVLVGILELSHVRTDFQKLDILSTVELVSIL